MVTYSYNGEGGVSVTNADGATATYFLNESDQVARFVDPLGNITNYTYDANNNLIQETGPGGVTTTFTNNAAGDTTSTTDPLGDTITATYDSLFNNLTSLTDPDGNTTQYTYDSNGNLLDITYPDSTQQQFTYDPTGNLIESVDQNGNATHYTYNSAGLLTEEDFADGSTITFSYDAHDNLISATNSSGTTSFTYNSSDELTEVTYPNGMYLKFTYNAVGQRTQMVDQTGFTVNYEYDHVGRLSELTDGSGNMIAQYTYDAAGLLTCKDLGNGTYTNFGYDLDGDLTSIVNYEPGGTVLSSYDYAYNDLGLPDSGATLDGTTTYGYDATDQLTSVDLPGGSTITYQYDAAGNRVGVTDNGVTTNYTTNDMNEYTQVGSTTYTYDKDGNLTSSTDSSGTTSYSYNDLGQPVSVVSPQGTWTYQYDALGNLIAETQNGEETQYLIDPTGIGNVVGTFDANGNLIDHYTQGIGLTSQVDAMGNAAYYNFDLTGNTTELTGANGAVLNTYSYLPFGEQLSATGSTPNPFTYVGQFGVSSDGSGQFFMRNRWYDGATGRFTQPDPIGLAGGEANYYQYAFNTPTNTIDPLGESADWPSWGDEGGAGVAPSPANSDTGGPQPTSQPADAPASTSTNPGLSTFWNTLNWANTARQAVEAEEHGEEAGNALTKAGNLLHSAQEEAGDPNASPGPDLEEYNNIGATGGVLAPAAGKSQRFLEDTQRRTLSPPTPRNAVALLAGLIGFFKGFAQSFKPVKYSNSTHLKNGDPNNLIGPAGFGTGGFITPDQTLPYTIMFANEPTADIPVQQVVVTDQLDPSLDWTTFQVGDFSIGGTVYAVPPNDGSYSTQLDLTSTLGIYLEVTAGINFSTGVATWTFTSVDPTTGDLPSDIFTGFLPPDSSPPSGEATVNYTIRPKAGVTTGTQINAQAVVVFDTNAPLATPQVLNTFDAIAPASAVTALPATTTTTTFPISWSGSDGAGSGIATYNVFVSEDGGPFTPFLTGTTQTSATFNGQFGHTYGFYSVATSNVGNVQPTPTTAQATTYLAALPTSTVNAPPATTGTSNVTLSWKGSPGQGATRIASYTIYVSEDGAPFTPYLSNTTQTSATFTGQYGHTYAFYSVATDNLGDRQTTPKAAQATTTIPPLVTLAKVSDMLNKKHQVTEVLVKFTGPVNAAQANQLATYHLATPGKHGSYTTKNAAIIKLRSAVYTASSNTVALTPKKPFALTKPVQLLVYGTGLSALQDTYGRAISGANNGQPGSNAVAILSRSGVKLNAVASSIRARTQANNPASTMIDALLNQNALAGLTKTIRQHLNHGLLREPD